MGDDRLRASLMASRHTAGTWLGRDDVQFAVPGYVGPRPIRRQVVLVWLPDQMVVLMAAGDHEPVGVLDEFARPVLPDVREGMTWDSWRFEHYRVRVHKGYRAVAGWVEG
jgi:hypothetical protein